MKKIYTLLVLLIFVSLGCQTANRIHQPLDIKDVSDIYLWADDAKFGRIQKMAADDEKMQIIDWFNSASDIRENKEFTGETPQSGITISFKSSQKSIQILRSGSDFEIQRDSSANLEQRVSYWARQKEIEKLLELLFNVPSEQQKDLVAKFISAQYSGDLDTLKLITKEAANISVKNGELNIFKSHKLDKIVSLTVSSADVKDLCEFIVAVSSAIPKDQIPTVYYEIFQLKKYGEKWFITKVERDA